MVATKLFFPGWDDFSDEQKALISQWIKLLSEADTIRGNLNTLLDNASPLPTIASTVFELTGDEGATDIGLGDRFPVIERFIFASSRISCREVCAGRTGAAYTDCINRCKNRSIRNIA